VLSTVPAASRGALKTEQLRSARRDETPLQGGGEP